MAAAGAEDEWALAERCGWAGPGPGRRCAGVTVSTWFGFLD